MWPPPSGRRDAWNMSRWYKQVLEGTWDKWVSWMDWVELARDPCCDDNDEHVGGDDHGLDDDDLVVENDRDYLMFRDRQNLSFALSPLVMVEAVDQASTTTALPATLDSSEVLVETDVSDSLTLLAAGCMSPLLEGRGSFRP